MPRTHSYGNLWMTRQVLENELGIRVDRPQQQTEIETYMLSALMLAILRRLLLGRLGPRSHEFGQGSFC